MHKMH